MPRTDPLIDPSVAAPIDAASDAAVDAAAGPSPEPMVDLCLVRRDGQGGAVVYLGRRQAGVLAAGEREVAALTAVGLRRLGLDPGAAGQLLDALSAVLQQPQR